MKHEILYVRADGIARGAIEGTDLQKKFEADPKWKRVFLTTDNREKKWEEHKKTIAKELNIPVKNAITKKPGRKRKAKKKPS